MCFDECSEGLHAQVADPIPVAPGHPAKEDDEYVRGGAANLFVTVEPPAGRRPVSVTDRRTMPDLAARMKDLCDELYPDADVIRVAVDNRNTHPPGALFSTDPPDEAWRLARRLELHSTPKHASWSNRAACGLSVLGRQGLDRQVAAWVSDRNRVGAKIEWTFRVADARKKLPFLYPKELVR